jgi:hypothetical protein
MQTTPKASDSLKRISVLEHRQNDVPGERFVTCFDPGHGDHAPGLALFGNQQAQVRISMHCHFSTFYWIIIVQLDIEQTVYKREEEKPNAGDEGYRHTPCFSS